MAGDTPGLQLLKNCYKSSDTLIVFFAVYPGLSVPCRFLFGAIFIASGRVTFARE